MGVSTDGIIAYGILLGGEGEESNYFTEDEWEEIRETYKDEEIEARGFDTINYCSGDYPMWFLAVPGTEVRASRGYPQQLSDGERGKGKLVGTPENIERWREAMDKLGVDRADEGWYLFSYWG